MAVQSKITIKRGQRAQDIAHAAGAAIAGSDAMFLNVDATNMSKGDALLLLEEFRKRIHESPWPLPTS